MKFMAFDRIGLRAAGFRAAGVRLTAVAAGVVGALAVASPACAQAPNEDTNPVNSVLGFFGMQFDKDRESIDYRARAPLVVPPRLDLPKPKVAARDPSWPNDPDIAERRHAAAAAQRPAPQITPNTRVEMSPQELAAGRTSETPKAGPPDDCQASAGTPLCLYTPWKVLTSMVGGAPDKVDPGVEPDRRYLTEPPVGYRRASAATTATIDIPKEAPDAGDARAYTRQQQRRNSIDD